MADEIDIKFGGDTSQLDAALAAVLREINKVGTAVDRAGDKFADGFDKKADKALRQTEQSTKKLIRTLNSLDSEENKRIKRNVALAAQMTIVKGALDASINVYGTAANAAIGFADGVFDAIRASEGLIQELSEVDNELFQFSETTQENIALVNDQFDAMLGISKMLTVQFAGEFTHAASEVTKLISHMGLAYAKANAKILEVSQGTAGLSTILLDLASGGGYSQIINVTKEANKLFGEQDAELDKLTESFAKTPEEIKKAKDEYQKFVKELEKSDRIVERAIEKLERIELKANVGGLEGMEKLNELFRQQWQEIDKIAASAMEEAKTQEQRAAIIAQHQASILALNEEHSREVQQQRDKDFEAFMKDVDNQIALEKKHKDEKDKDLKEQKDAQQKFVSDQQSLMRASADVMGDISSLFGDMLENTEGKSRQQMMRMFAMQKASAIGQAAINATLASMAALANPPGPPFTIPIAATVAALGAVQVAQIAAEPPPFHIGTRVSDLAPDEARITRREGLAVLTPQGIAAGGAEAVADANAGIPSGAGNQTVLFKYDHRMFDATITDNLKRSNSPLGNAIRRSSYGHRRRNG